ncbi:MAG: HD domain-containing phosphohydrolase [bacterium JZ-2024 1]
MFLGGEMDFMENVPESLQWLRTLPEEENIVTNPHQFLEHLAKHWKAKILMLSAPVSSKEYLDVVSVAGLEKGKIVKKVQFLSDSVAGMVWRSRKHLLLERVANAPDTQKRMLLSLFPRITSYLAFPLFAGSELFAVIELLDNNEGRLWDFRDLTKFQSHIPFLYPYFVHLVQSYAHQSTQNLLHQVISIGQHLGKEKDILSIIRYSEEEIRNLVQAEHSCILLYDESRTHLSSPLGTTTKKVIPGEGITGKSAWTGDAYFTNAPQKDPAFLGSVDLLFPTYLKHLLVVPLRSAQKVLGVISCCNSLRGGFSQIDLETLQSMSTFVTSTLESLFLYQNLERLFYSTIEALVSTVDARDPYTAGHSLRVRDFSLAIGKRMIRDPEKLKQLELSAVLHDIGKIGIRDEILYKPTGLTPQEYELLKEHVLYGEKILQSIPRMEEIIGGVKYHHEKYDGSGYPEGLKGSEIPLFGRIIGIADTFDAMTTDRPYRKGLPDEIAVAEIRKMAGTQFDPRAVEAFTRAFEEGEVLSEARRKEKGIY